MKISVQMLAFRTETVLPTGMLRACVAQFYNHVDQITIVEGATKALDPKRFDGDATSFTEDGSSHDGTLECLMSLEDPEDKIHIVKSVGFWDGKTQMANESAKRATGDYLWEISSDEFYRTQDILKVKALLEEKRPDAVHFYANHFVGGFRHVINDETGHLWGNDIPWARLYRNEPGSHWITHEPPEYQLASGLICNQGRVIGRDETKALGIKLFHYGYAGRSQATFKATFYGRPEYVQMWDSFQTNKATPWINGTLASEFTGEHPEAIQSLLSNSALWHSC